MDWQIPLLASTIVFAIYLVFKFRPAVSSDGRATTAALKEAKLRISAAKDDSARSEALADAAEACARLGRGGAAVSFWLRALRTNPTSSTIVERAIASLSRRPLALEGLLWRHLGAEPWTGNGRASAIAALRGLRIVYERKPRLHPRARAVEHALAALGAEP